MYESDKIKVTKQIFKKMELCINEKVEKMWRETSNWWIDVSTVTGALAPWLTESFSKFFKLVRKYLKKETEIGLKHQAVQRNADPT